jgi:hypothetical protein
MKTNYHAIIRNYSNIAKISGSPTALYPNGDTVEDAYAIVAAAGHLQQKPGENQSSPGVDMLTHTVWLTAKMIGNDKDFTTMLEDMNSNYNVGWNKAHAEFVQQKLLYRRFFTTEKGYLGLGPGTVKAADQVCVLFGNRTPLILRKVSCQLVYRGPIVCSVF